MPAEGKIIDIAPLENAGGETRAFGDAVTISTEKSKTAVSSQGPFSERYKPGDKFEEDTNEPLVDISMTDSTELWLIQWPVKHLSASDFHGKELKLKLNRDGTLGSLEASSGKTYEMISYASQQPNATVLLPTSSGSKVVGKISRRVCLRRYVELDELTQPSIANRNLSILKGSQRNSSQRSTVSSVFRGSPDTLTFGHSMDQRKLESPESSRKKKKKKHHGDSSHGSKPESHVTETTTDSGTKKKKKKDKAVDED